MSDVRSPLNYVPPPAYSGSVRKARFGYRAQVVKVTWGFPRVGDWWRWSRRSAEAKAERELRRCGGPGVKLTMHYNI